MSESEATSGGGRAAREGVKTGTGSLVSPRDVMTDLARWSRVANLNGDLHARVASALILMDQQESELEVMTGALETERRRKRARVEGLAELLVACKTVSDEVPGCALRDGLTPSEVRLVNRLFEAFEALDV